MKTTQKTQKEVTVLFTYIFKALIRVCFVVLSSDGETRYHTCFDNGRASCTCPAGAKGVICYHVKQLRPRYDAIIASRQQETPAATPEQIAAVEEVKAEAKLAAFKAGMEEQYASDPRVTCYDEEAENRSAYIRMMEAEY